MSLLSKALAIGAPIRCREQRRCGIESITIPLRSGCQERIGSKGWVRSSARISGFLSIHSTGALG